jgi:DNA-directed RNA polymerase subunit RPC12/RpoP
MSRELAPGTYGVRYEGGVAVAHYERVDGEWQETEPFTEPICAVCGVNSTNDESLGQLTCERCVVRILDAELHDGGQHGAA